MVQKIISIWGMFEAVTVGVDAGVGFDIFEKYCDCVLAEGGGVVILSFSEGNDGRACFFM